MNIIRASIERPTAVVAAIFMTIVLGFLALDRIPIQLAPDVNKPVKQSLPFGMRGISMKSKEKLLIDKKKF